MHAPHCTGGLSLILACFATSSIGIDWEEFNNGGKLETQDGAVFLMNPEEIPPFTGDLPEEIADKTGRTILLAQLTVNAGTTFTGHVNVQGRRRTAGHGRSTASASLSARAARSTRACTTRSKRAVWCMEGQRPIPVHV